VDFYTVHTRYKIGLESRGAALSAFVLDVVEEEAGGGDVAAAMPCWLLRAVVGSSTERRTRAPASKPGRAATP
jgi:hypothetical protein